MKAAVYARVSTDEQAREGQSLGEQQRLGRERATLDEAVVDDAHVYVDQMSGSRADRPAYQQMLADAAAGVFDRLYVWKFDRLGRDAEERLRARRMLAAAGVDLVSITGEDSSTLSYGIDALMSQIEREKIGERTKLGLAAVARTGRSAGGQPPLGYRIVATGTWDVDRAEAAILHRIDELYLAGKGVNMIVRILIADGVKTRRGADFSTRVILNLLDQPAYLGLHRFKGVLHQGTHPPLRTEETWQRIQALRSARKQSVGRRGAQPSRHLLTRGLLRCPCGAGMGARHIRNTGHDYYVCTHRHMYGPERCATPYIRREAIDEPLLHIFEAHVLDVDATVAGIRGEAERLIGEARSREQQSLLEVGRADDALGRVRADYLAGTLEVADWTQLRDELALERAAAAAEADRHGARAAELDREADRLDAEETFARRIADLRDLVVGSIDTTGELEALRAALTGTFERFDLAEQSGRWIAVPRLRGDRHLDVARTPSEFLLPARRVPLPGSEPSAPSPHFQSPLLDALFAPFPVAISR